ncbi:hypothetical protein SEA_LEWANDO_71 [Arthrobacter phage Lewando]|nr:hypothetical protein SEA_LEWANDO_71 [Arthrobacter phage Lewando]
MPTFKSKSKIVDARHFIGGAANAEMLVRWIQAHGGKATYTHNISSDGSEVQTSETISIRIEAIKGEMRRYTANLEDWIVLDTKGNIKPCPPYMFWDEYEEV